jgi:hypothetical protein
VTATGAGATASGDGGRDLAPEDLVMKEPRDKRPKPKRPRNRQAREDPLMGMLAWVMTAWPIWHFTIFLPDRFWSGIVGAFVGALVGWGPQRP